MKSINVGDFMEFQFPMAIFDCEAVLLVEFFNKKTKPSATSSRFLKQQVGYGNWLQGCRAFKNASPFIGSMRISSGNQTWDGKWTIEIGDFPLKPPFTWDYPLPCLSTRGYIYKYSYSVRLALELYHMNMYITRSKRLSQNLRA